MSVVCCQVEVFASADPLSRGVLPTAVCRIPPEAWVSVCCECCVCCQVEVFASADPLSRGVLPTVVSACDREAPTARRPWLIRGCYAMRGEMFM